MTKLHPLFGTENGARKADVVFVHGIADDWAGCWWAGQGAPDIHNFFPYWLGEDVREIAVWSLAYDAGRSEWTGSAMPLEIRATNVLDEMRPRVGERPLVFIAHSLGGLVVKQILRNASDLPDPAYRRIAEQTRGILFLSTPHSGSNLANWYEFLGFTHPSAAMQDLKQNTEKLQNLNFWMRSFYQRRAAEGPSCEIKVYYEERKTPLKRFYGIKVVPLLIVDRTSADPGITDIVPVGMDRDHIQICKPRDRSDRIFEVAREFVQERLAVIAAEATEAARIPVGPAIPLGQVRPDTPPPEPITPRSEPLTPPRQPATQADASPAQPAGNPAPGPAAESDIPAMLLLFPHAGLAFAQKRALIDALLAMPGMKQAATRAALVRDIGSDIEGSVAEESQALLHVSSIINTCLDFDDGLVRLDEVLSNQFKGTIKLREWKQTVMSVHRTLVAGGAGRG